MNLEQQGSAVVAKFDMLVDEMRDRDNQRIKDISEIRAGIDGMGKHVRNLVWTSMAAIGAMVVTVIFSILKS